jgi:hypothetical protein
MQKEVIKAKYFAEKQIKANLTLTNIIRPHWME